MGLEDGTELALLLLAEIAIGCRSHATGLPCKEACIVVVAVGVKRVNAKVIPHLCVYLIFLLAQGFEVNKCHYGIAGDVPSAEPGGYALLLKLAGQGGEQLGVGGEERVGFLLFA